jgi:hypothetical protein
LAIGEYDVDRMLRRLTAKQFYEWQVFASLEPFAPEREDIRTGLLVMVQANAHRKKGTKAWTLAECTPMFGDSEAPKKKILDWKALKAFAIDMTAASRAKPSERIRRKRGT